jgi:Domain of unknown function (DUF6984)
LSSAGGKSESYYDRLARQPLRPLRAEEREVVAALVAIAPIDQTLASAQALDAARVRDMLDGGMGSIWFLSPRGDVGRKADGVVSHLWYVDTDGVGAWLALLVDTQGELFELDIWKVDYSPLLRYPRRDQLEPAKINYLP